MVNGKVICNSCAAARRSALTDPGLALASPGRASGPALASPVSSSVAVAQPRTAAKTKAAPKSQGSAVAAGRQKVKGRVTFVRGGRVFELGSGHDLWHCDSSSGERSSMVFCHTCGKYSFNIFSVRGLTLPCTGPPDTVFLRRLLARMKRGEHPRHAVEVIGWPRPGIRGVPWLSTAEEAHEGAAASAGAVGPPASPRSSAQQLDQLL